MSREDWYRRTTWSPEDQRGFFARLNRSRTPFHKAQYVRIQALYLQRIGTPDMLASAVELLDTLLEKWPEPSQLASAYLQMARCFDTLGRIGEAIQAYKAAFDAERRYPNVRTTARLDFALFVANRELSNLYEDALTELEKYSDSNGFTFPFEEYEYCAAKALILEHHGKAVEARSLAQRAVRASKQTYSGFSHHPKVGLVEKCDPALNRKLMQLTSAQEPKRG